MKEYGQLVTELFKPSPFLQQMIEMQGLEENSYIAVHLRFVNALEQFELGFSITWMTQAGKN